MLNEQYYPPQFLSKGKCFGLIYNLFSHISLHFCPKTESWSGLARLKEFILFSLYLTTAWFKHKSYRISTPVADKINLFVCTKRLICDDYAVIANANIQIKSI
jgi:hypothetical protein